MEFIDGESAVENDEIVGVDHFVVLLENARLEKAKTFRAIVGEAHVHAGFVIFQFGTAAENAVDGDIERSAEIKGDVGNGSKTVEIAQPAMGTAAGGIAREGSVDVTVGEDEIVALEQRHDLALAAIRKIGSMQKGEGGGSEKALLLAATGGGLDEGRGIPFGEVEAIAANFEPALE